MGCEEQIVKLGSSGACRQEIEKLIRMLPPKDGRQNMLFSATYPSNIRELTSIALRPQYQLVDTVGEEDTHAAEMVYCSWCRIGQAFSCF